MPDALLGPFWAAARQPSGPSLEPLLNTVLEVVPLGQVLSHAIHNGLWNVVALCAKRWDLAWVDDQGNPLVHVEGSDRPFIESVQADPGWVARLAFGPLSGPAVNLVLLSTHCSAPDVWSQSLPFPGHRVSWLELALGAGHSMAAEHFWNQARWQSPSPLADPAVLARLAVAWMSRLLHPRNGDQWETLGDFSRRDFPWVDRLLTPEVLRQDVPITEGWFRRMFDSAPDPSLPITVRPLDLLLVALCEASKKTDLGRAVLARLEALGWFDGAGFSVGLPARALLERLSAQARHYGEFTLGKHALDVLLRGMSEPEQSRWWFMEVRQRFSGGGVLDCVPDLFAGRYGWSQVLSVRALLPQALNEERCTGLGRSEIVRRFRRVVLPVLGPVLAPSAKKEWEARFPAIDAALLALEEEVVTRWEPDRDPGPAWRALGLAWDLPGTPAQAKPSRRF